MPNYLLDHVAIGTRAHQGAVPCLVSELGGEYAGGGPNPGFDFAQFRYANGARIEILQPTGAPNGFLFRFLEHRGPGIHHVTFKVPNLDDACDRARTHGYEVVGYSTADPSWKEAFLHPKQAQGIVVQMAEVDDTAQEPDHGPWQAPALPKSAPPAVEVVGPRMVAESAAFALKLWRDVLRGDVEHSGDTLVFSWPESVLRVHVRIDGEVSARSEAILIRSDREIPDEAVPELGTRFIRVD